MKRRICDLNLIFMKINRIFGLCKILCQVLCNTSYNKIINLAFYTNLFNSLFNFNTIEYYNVVKDDQFQIGNTVNRNLDAKFWI